MTNSDDSLVSVIVPVYNVEQYIEKCVDSLISQTLPNIEIILVDDGSTDKSAEISDAYAKEHSNIKVIHKENGGLGSARNAGMKVANGKYIGFVDSDDYVSERMYKTLLDLVVDNDADCAYCEFTRFWNNKVNLCENEKCEVKTYSGDEILNSYLLDRIGCKPSEKEDCTYGASVGLGLFKKDVILRNNINFVSERVFIAEDMIFDIDFIPKCRKIVHTSESLYFYRFNPNSLTTRYVMDRFEKNVTLCHEMKSRLSQIYHSDVYEIRLNRYFLKITRISLIEEVVHINRNGWWTARKNINRIANNDELEDILKFYPIALLPFKQKMFFFALKHKMYLLVAILIKINILKNGDR